MVKVSIEDFLPSLAEQVYSQNGIATLIVQQDVDALLAWCLLSTRLKRNLGIRYSTVVVSSLEDVIWVMHKRPLEGPTVVIGVDHDLRAIVANCALMGNQFMTFHLTRRFNEIFQDREAIDSDHYHIVSCEGREHTALMRHPLITTLVGLSLSAPNIDNTGVGNLISIAAAAECDRGELSRLDYKELIQQIRIHGQLTGEQFENACSVVTKSTVSDCHFPGLFFYSMTLKENMESSIIVNKHLFDLPAEARDIELKNVRVKLGCSTEEWDTVFQDLGHQRQHVMLKKLKEIRIADLDISGETLQYPVITFNRKRIGGVKSGDSKLSNLDMAFLFATAISGNKYAAKSSPEIANNSKDFRNDMILRMKRMTKNGISIRKMYDAFGGLIGMPTGRELHSSHEAIRESTLCLGLQIYKRIGERSNTILMLLNDRLHSLTKENSTAFKLKDNFHVVYLTESAMVPLCIYEARYLMIHLSAALSTDKNRNPIPSALIMVHAGHRWSKLSVRQPVAVSQQEWASGCCNAFKNIAKANCISEDIFLSSTFHTMVRSDVLWQLFSSLFEKEIKASNRVGKAEAKRGEPTVKRRKGPVRVRT